jgi:hypothetical protein
MQKWIFVVPFRQEKKRMRSVGEENKTFAKLLECV